MPSKPEPAIPNPAAVLHGEADILANVLADLADDTAKLVYADWLEERDDPRGPFLRRFVNAFRDGSALPDVSVASEPWRNLLGLTLIQKAQGTGLESKIDQLLALARPAFAYTTPKAQEESLPVGASKFGGRPDLPPETEWPRYENDPLAFLGQFNLAEIRSSPVARELPVSGLLSAFALYRGDGDDSFPDGTWRLLHFPDATTLVRRELDYELRAEAQFPSCRVAYLEVLTLPHSDSPWRTELEALGDVGIGSAYMTLFYALYGGNQVLGYPCPIQFDMLGHKDVRHLLTIHGNDETGWEFGDGGALYFTLPEADLRQGRFDRVAMFMDCA